MGSYSSAFYMAGSVAIVGAAIPFLLLFIRRNAQVIEIVEQHSHDPPMDAEIELLTPA